MDAHHTIVNVALAAKSDADTPKKVRWEVRSETMPETSRPPVAPTIPTVCSALLVFVVVAPPVVGFVAALGRAVEPLISTPQAVQSAGIGGIGMIDDAVLQGEGA